MTDYLLLTKDKELHKIISSINNAYPKEKGF